MPISGFSNYTAEHWQSILSIITEALSPELVVNLVSDAKETAIIQKSIFENIIASNVIVCDISGLNPNVMFELGVTIAFQKKLVLLKDDLTKPPFDISSIEHLIYPVTKEYKAIVNLKRDLKTKVGDTLISSRPSILGSYNFTVPKIETTQVTAFEKIEEQLKYINHSLVEIKLSQINIAQPNVIYLKDHQKPYYLEIIENYKKLMGINDLRDLNMAKDDIIQDIMKKAGNVRPPERSAFIELIDRELRDLTVNL